ncbi:MAG: hypothetical protein ACLFWB_03630 [Armatimonadota bacterium]
MGKSEEKKCPQCGEVVLQTDVQCMECGANLTAHLRAPKPASRRRRFSIPRIAWLGPLVFVGIAGLGGAAYWWFGYQAGAVLFSYQEAEITDIQQDGYDLQVHFKWPARPSLAELRACRIVYGYSTEGDMKWIAREIAQHVEFDLKDDYVFYLRQDDDGENFDNAVGEYDYWGDNIEWLIGAAALYSTDTLRIGSMTEPVNDGFVAHGVGYAPFKYWETGRRAGRRILSGNVKSGYRRTINVPSDSDLRIANDPEAARPDRTWPLAFQIWKLTPGEMRPVSNVVTIEASF